MSSRRDIGLKLDLGGVILTESDFMQADSILRKTCLTKQEAAQYDKLLEEASKTRDWNEFIEYKIKMRGEVAKRNPRGFINAFEKTLGRDYLNSLRKSIRDYKKTTGKRVAIHSTMNKRVSNLFAKLVGADTSVKKFIGREGTAVEDFEGRKWNRAKYFEEYLKNPYLAKSSKKMNPRKEINDIVRYQNWAREVEKAKKQGKPVTFRGQRTLDNWADLGNKRLPDVIRKISKRRR